MLACRKREFRQVTIETVYLDDNRSSHFNPSSDAAHRSQRYFAAAGGTFASGWVYSLKSPSTGADSGN